jgi:hypothetical protein
MKIVIFCNGYKGGVGKSTTARAVADYVESEGINFILFEANPDTPDFAGFYPSRFADGNNIFEFSSSSDTIDAPNIIFEQLTAAPDGSVAVVNMPSSVFLDFHAWVEGFGIFDYAKSKNISLVNMLVTSGDPESLQAIENCIQSHADGMKHFIIRNLKFIDPKNYPVFSPSLAALVDKYSIGIFDLPALPARIQDTLVQNQLSYTEARNLKDESIFLELNKFAVRSFLNKCKAMLDSTGIFDSVKSKKSSPAK